MSEKLYVINTPKRIPCLNNITGPVTKPTEMNPTDALTLAKQGYDVYEVNPYDKKERVKVTPYNFNSIHFKTSEYDMIQRKKLNRELQNMDKDNTSEVKDTKKEEKPSTEPVKKEEKKEESKKEEFKKEDKKDKSDKKVETEEVKAQKISHTDFTKQ